MDDFWLGYAWDWRTGRAGNPITYSDHRHVTLFGPTRSGKGVSVEIPCLLAGGAGWRRPRFRCASVLSIDPKLENLSVAAKWRGKFSRLWPINPSGILGIPSIGFNPLRKVKADSPHLVEQAQGIAEIIAPAPRSTDPFWPESARDLATFLICWEVIRAAKEGRVPTLPNARDMATEPVEMATDANGNEYEIRGLRATAARAVASGDRRISGLAYRYTRESRTNDGIIATFLTATRWLASAAMRADLSVATGADFSLLRCGPDPISCFVGLPAHELETFNPWLKLVVTTALNSIYEQGGMPGRRVRFMLSEYAALASGGDLKAITAALGQGAGYGIQLAPIVLQDINQLRAIHGKDQAETFLGMSGATVAFTPNDYETADWMSRRSGDRRYAALSASDDPNTADARLSYQEKRERLIPPDAMFSIPRWHGLCWLAGQSAPQPIHLPPYWEIRALRGRYSPNPYHQ